jgi:hypothetical protein
MVKWSQVGSNGSRGIKMMQVEFIRRLGDEGLIWKRFGKF